MSVSGIKIDGIHKDGVRYLKRVTGYIFLSQIVQYMIHQYVNELPFLR